MFTYGVLGSTEVTVMDYFKVISQYWRGQRNLRVYDVKVGIQT
jgi:hypothetical protein